jgi:hypothetical protein
VVLVEEFNRALVELEQRYGKPTMDGRVAQSGKDFLSTVRDNPELYFVTWRAPQSKKRFPSVSSIVLRLEVRTEEENYVELEYWFDNAEKCAEATRSDQDRAL